MRSVNLLSFILFSVFLEFLQNTYIFYHFIWPAPTQCMFFIARLCLFVQVKRPGHLCAKILFWFRFGPKGPLPMILQGFFISCQGAAKCRKFAHKRLLCFKRLCIKASVCLLPPAYFQIALFFCFNVQHCFLWKKMNEEYIHLSLVYQKTHKQ